MAKYKRKNYLINKPLQLKYTAIILAIVTTYSVFIFYSVNFSLHSMLDSLSSVNSATVLAIRRQNESILFSTIGFLILNVISVGFLWILAMHKIAGPLYRLQKSIKEVNNGRMPGEIRLRKGDELFEIIGDFNKMTSTLRSDTRQDADKLGVVLEKATVLLTGLKETPSIDSAKLLEFEQLVAGLREMRDTKIRAADA